LFYAGAQCLFVAVSVPVMLAGFVFMRVRCRRMRMLVRVRRNVAFGVRVFVLRVVVRMLVFMRYLFVRVFVFMFVVCHCLCSFISVKFPAFES